MAMQGWLLVPHGEDNEKMKINAAHIVRAGLATLLMIVGVAHRASAQAPGPDWTVREKLLLQKIEELQSRLAVCE